jgi:hypothetical protein
MDAPRPSRIEEARRRASRAKTALGAGAATAFVLAGALAWSSHPGSSRTTQSSSDSSSSSVSSDDSTYYDSSDDDDDYGDDDGSTFNYGSGSISPGGGSQPQVGSSAS